MNDRNINDAVDYILQNAKKFAKAKAERIYIEEFRKSKKAILMQKSTESAISAQERDAYAHEEYQELLLGLQGAIEVEELLRWQLIAAQARIDIYRTESANNRAMDKITM